MSKWAEHEIRDTTDDSLWELDMHPTVEPDPLPVTCNGCGLPVALVWAKPCHGGGYLCPRCERSIEAHAEQQAREQAEDQEFDIDRLFGRPRPAA